MKKILFAAMAALAITGCSQNEEVEAPAKKAEISFNTAVSRAATTTNADFKSFTAYAYSHTGEFSSATAVNALIPGTEFTSTDGNDWSAKENKVFYWPETDKVSFFAFSIATPGEVTWAAATAKNVPTLAYTVKTTIKDQEDLVVAEVMNKQKSAEGATAGVALNFKHALTKIGFKVRGTGEGVTYTVNKIVIKAKNKGTYTYAGSATDGTLGTWDITGASEGTYTIEPTTALTINGSDTDETTNDTFTESADYIAMLIPQELKDNVTIDVHYEAKVGETTLCDKTTTPQTITFTDGSWDAGQNVAYTLVLQSEKITISGSLTDDWNTFTDGGTLGEEKKE
ncbi:fimbrillin family protein [Phocaeicola sp.]